MANLNLLLCSLEAMGSVKEVRTTKGLQSYKCQCPAHDDRTPSLVVTITDNDKILLKCWAGCTVGEILSALNLPWKVLMPDSENYNILAGRRNSGPTEEDFLVAIADSAKRGGKVFSREDKIAELRARKQLIKRSQYGGD